MISYIKGELTFKSPTHVVIETGGIGYHVNISLYTYARIEKAERTKLLTYLHVKEDSQTLYGFDDASERHLFKHLISVSGIGPNTARIMLSSMSPDELKAAIIGEDIVAFKKVKGVGPKTAKRIILDLKDKIVKENGDQPLLINPVNNTSRKEALSALVTLGFMKVQAQKAVNKIIKESPNEPVEGIIKKALKLLS